MQRLNDLCRSPQMIDERGDKAPAQTPIRTGLDFILLSKNAEDNEQPLEILLILGCYLRLSCVWPLDG